CIADETLPKCIIKTDKTWDRKILNVEQSCNKDQCIHQDKITSLCSKINADATICRTSFGLKDCSYGCCTHEITRVVSCCGPGTSVSPKYERPIDDQTYSNFYGGREEYSSRKESSKVKF
ncbi:hypothetical protein MAR_020825, partial [Mya arenaria]